jgi:hypothetical protein
MKKNTTYYENLLVALDLLAIEYPDVNSDYQQLADLVNKEFPLDFNNEVTERDIWVAFEPDIPTEELDLRVQHNYLF